MRTLGITGTLYILMTGVFFLSTSSTCSTPTDIARTDTHPREARMEIDPIHVEKATIGGGCFWCIEAVFERIDGVLSAISGYAGGSVANPDYENVCTGETGHAEVVQIEFDTNAISYEQILSIFFKAHDPTTSNSQGADVGSQYRSIILYHDERQKEAALAKIAELDASGENNRPVCTEVKEFERFYPAEDYHQDFFKRNPDYGYCRIVIEPKIRKLDLH
jgi:peptide-methionine (S)-S-oxide reductase